MKLLIAVVTCGKFEHRADAQRATWAKDVHGADLRFFLAKQDRDPLADEVFLDVPDDYESLPLKVRAMHVWARENNYDFIFKTDDDTYVNADNLLASVVPHDYYGFINFTPPTPWCSGFGYWTSSRASEIISTASIPAGEWAEDRWVGGVLNDHGIRPYTDKLQTVSGDQTGRYILILPPYYGMEWNPAKAAAICDVRPEGSATMQQLHELSTGVQLGT